MTITQISKKEILKLLGKNDPAALKDIYILSEREQEEVVCYHRKAAVTTKRVNYMMCPIEKLPLSIYIESADRFVKIEDESC